MPRNVRNVWIDASIDGRHPDLSGGPVSKDGGMSAMIYIRNNGSVAGAVRLSLCADDDGTLTLNVYPLSDVRPVNTIGQGFTVITHRNRTLSRSEVLRAAGMADSELDAPAAAS